MLSEGDIMVKIDCNIGIKDDAAKGTVKKTVLNMRA